MWILVFLFINRAFKALSDILKSSFDASIFVLLKDKYPALYIWSKPGLSWKLKWKYVDGKRVLQTKKLWYYLWIFTPEYTERFPYSSTFLVKYTDLWHTSEYIRRAMIILILIFTTLASYGYVNNSYIIPYIIWFLDINILYLVLNILALGTATQLVGFTIFYDYLLRITFWKNGK